MRKFNELPQDIQTEVKQVLKAYNRVYVVFENGKYQVNASIAIKRVYASDHEVLGDYNADEMFTKEEQLTNYVEAFHEFPIYYKGTRDYDWIRSLTWDDKIALDDNGNLYKL